MVNIRNGDKFIGICVHDSEPDLVSDYRAIQNFGRRHPTSAPADVWISWIGPEGLKERFDIADHIQNSAHQIVNLIDRGIKRTFGGGVRGWLREPNKTCEDITKCIRGVHGASSSHRKNTRINSTVADPAP